MSVENELKGTNICVTSFLVFHMMSYAKISTLDFILKIHEAIYQNKVLVEANSQWNKVARLWAHIKTTIKRIKITNEKRNESRCRRRNRQIQAFEVFVAGRKTRQKSPGLSLECARMADETVITHGKHPQLKICLRKLLVKTTWVSPAVPIRSPVWWRQSVIRCHFIYY